MWKTYILSHPRPLDFKDRSPFMSFSIATCAAEQDPPCDNTWLDVKCNLEQMWLLPTYLFLSSAERLNRTFIFDQLTLGVTELTLWSAEEIVVITSDVVTSGKRTLFHVILRLKISANEAPAITQHYSKWNVWTKCCCKNKCLPGFEMEAHLNMIIWTR